MQRKEEGEKNTLQVKCNHHNIGLGTVPNNIRFVPGGALCRASNWNFEIQLRRQALIATNLQPTVVVVFVLKPQVYLRQDLQTSFAS